MNLSAGFLNKEHLKQLVAKAIVCGMLLVLSACQIPKLRHAEPGPSLPTTFNGAASQENSAQLTVEEFYNDPLLTNLLHQALTGNRELKALNEEVQVARNQILSRQGAFLPFIGIRGGAGLNRPSVFTPEGAVERNVEYLPGRHFPDPLPDFLLGLNVFWQLDIWRELRNARDAAAKRYLSAIERRNDFTTRLVAEIAENYYGLIALDKRLETVNQTIALQERNLEIAESRLAGARGTVLGVQRFQAEVRRVQSERAIVRQEIIEAENRINYRAYRFPQPVERMSADFFDLKIHALDVGVPAQLLLNRPDIRQAERELEAAGLDVKVARAHFFPRLDLMGGVGYQAFNPKYLFATPDALVANIAGDLTAPLINKKAIQADYMSANARQLESVYEYQRIILNAFTEVVNRLSMVENYGRSIEIKKQQLDALVAAVETARTLYQNARVEYVDILFAQRDLMDARLVLIETKRRQLSAIVSVYQALGGGYLSAIPYTHPQQPPPNPPQPHP